MNQPKQMVISGHDTEHGSFGSYTVGFLASIGLTLAAYFIVTHHILSRHSLMASIAVLALVQFLVQLFFFLHLGRETKPRWKLLVLSFMIMVVVILVGGSLWIMSNLNYNMHMTPEQVKTYLHNNEGL